MKAGLAGTIFLEALAKKWREPGALDLLFLL